MCGIAHASPAHLRHRFSWSGAADTVAKTRGLITSSSLLLATLSITGNAMPDALPDALHVNVAASRERRIFQGVR